MLEVTNPNFLELQTRKQELIEQKEKLINDSKSAATKKSYDSDLRNFYHWCQQYGERPLPASTETVALYITNISQRLSYSSIQRHLAAIAQIHRDNKLYSPTDDQEVKNLLKGLAKNMNTEQYGKSPLTLIEIKKIIDVIEEYPYKRINERMKFMTIKRDRALMIAAFFLAVRRSDLMNVRYEDLTILDNGIDVHVNHGKVGLQQSNFIQSTGGDNCPVKIIQEWLDVSGITSGYLFRRIWPNGELGNQLSGAVLATTIKKYVATIGLNPDDYSGHSTRRGFATYAVSNNVPIHKVQRHLGHSKFDTTLKYVDTQLRRQDTSLVPNVSEILG